MKEPNPDEIREALDLLDRCKPTPTKAPPLMQKRDRFFLFAVWLVWVLIANAGRKGENAQKPEPPPKEPPEMLVKESNGSE